MFRNRSSVSQPVIHWILESTLHTMIILNRKCYVYTFICSIAIGLFEKEMKFKRQKYDMEDYYYELAMYSRTINNNAYTYLKNLTINNRMKTVFYYYPVNR